MNTRVIVTLVNSLANTFIVVDFLMSKECDNDDAAHHIDCVASLGKLLHGKRDSEA
jgi:hypothetical protein